MNRFDQDGLFDRLAVRDALGLDLMPPLASAIAQFHLAAERLLDHGGRAGMAWVIDGNARGFGEEGAGILDPALAPSLTNDSRPPSPVTPSNSTDAARRGSFDGVMATSICGTSC